MSPEPTTQGGPIRSLRSKTGCKTCKIRRVKCGEEKPQCLRCRSTGRRCDFASNLFNSSSTASFVPREYFPVINSPAKQERRAFEYYYFHAAPALGDFLDIDFWRGTILQVCRSEPAVWDAVVSLSTLYEHPPRLSASGLYQIEHTDSIVRPQSLQHKFALMCYSRSLKKIQDQIQHGLLSLMAALVSCVLFFCIETLHGNIKTALALYHQGTKLMASISTKRDSDQSLTPTIAPILHRVGAVVSIITGISTLPKREFHPHGSEPGCANLLQSRETLYSLITDWKVFDCDCAALRQQPLNEHTELYQQLYTRQRTLEGSLLSWHRHFTSIEEVRRYLKSTDPSSNTRSAGYQHPSQGIVATLLITYICILVLTRTGLSQDETVYDSHELDFANIIAHAPTALAASVVENGHQPPFVFDMGVSLPLFITALKCRSPKLRRCALSLLRSAPPLHGLYVCHQAASFVAAIVAIEENGPCCPQQELLIDTVLASSGRVPCANERIFALHIDRSTAETRQTRSTLRLSRRERVGDVERVVTDVVILPTVEP